MKFAGVRECPPWCSIVGATVTVHQFFCILHSFVFYIKCPLLWEFWINNFSRKILERVLVGNIVNIRNECLFFWVHGVWIVARNKQITRELRGSRDWFVPRYDSYPMNSEKRHSFLNTTPNMYISVEFVFLEFVKWMQ